MNRLCDLVGLLENLSLEIADLAAGALPKTCSVWTKSEDLAAGGSGSGWVFDSEHIVTNEHVVSGFADQVKIRFPNQKEKIGQVVGSDALTDLAIVRVLGIEAEPMTRRVSPALRRGELCMTLGSPLGEFNESVSLGVISGLNRQIDMGTHKFEEAIQVDATINSGNSGGPLIDMRGNLIGVNFCSRRDAAQINFAIPTEVVEDVIPELLTHGSIKRAGLGIAISAVPVSVKGSVRSAVEVQRTKEGSQLRRGDVILAIDGAKVERRYDLIRKLNRDSIGRPVRLHVFRDEQVLELDEVPIER